MSRGAPASSSMTAGEAFALLGLASSAPPEAVKAAFKSAVKAARPDQGRGDPERFRRVIEAYRLIQRLQSARAALGATVARSSEAPSTPVLEITVAEAMLGLSRHVRIGGLEVAGVRLPAGLRNDDKVRLAGRGPQGSDLIARVRILAEANRTVVGCDLWVTTPVPAQALAEGGRIEFEAPGGGGFAAIPPGFPPDGRIKLAGRGLPARGARTAGDLYLKPVAEAQAPSRRLWSPRARPDRRAAGG